MQSEIWKDIQGYDGMYQVSNRGRVISYRHGVRVLKSNKDRYGYLSVVLCDGSHQRTKTVHRLVALAFIPNPDNKPEIDHINTIRTDNRVENLRWVTRKENANNPLTMCKYKETTHIYRALDKRRKPVYQMVSGKIVAQFDSIRDAERATGISHQNIASVLRGRSRLAGSYEWEYEK